MLFQIPCQSDDLDEIEAYHELQLLFNMLGYKRQKSRDDYVGEKFLIDSSDENIRVRHWYKSSFDDFIDYTLGDAGIDSQTKHFTSYIDCLARYKKDQARYHQGDTTDVIQVTMPIERSI